MATKQDQNPAQAFQAVEAHRKQELLVKTGRDFTSMENVTELLFGKPDAAEDTFVRRQWEWLQTKEGYKHERDEAMLLMRITAQRVFEAMKKRMADTQATREETAEKLDALDKYLRTVGVVGQALKMVESPYAQAASPHQAGSTHEVMDVDEVLIMNRFTEFLNNLDVEELITMIEEDQGYITMLTEKMTLEGRSINDILPAGYSLRNVDRAPDGSRIAKLSPDNIEKYEHNLEHLRRFILGLPEEGGKEKSQNRIHAESVLWLEIVRALSPRQKEDLIVAFLKSGDPKAAEQTQDFMTTCVIGGVMTIEDVHEMIEAYKQSGTPLHEYFAKLPDDLEKRLKEAVSVRDQVKKEVEEAAQRLITSQVDNAATHFLTFNKIIASRVAEVGFLTFSLNFVLDIAERIRRRQELNETRGQAIVRGVGDALKDRNVWLGAAEMAWGSNVVYPWIRAAMLSKSEEEKELLAQYEEARYLREQVRNRPAIDEYFIENYDEMFDVAKRNADQESSLKKQDEKRREFEIYPGDLQLLPEGQRMTQERAVKLGFNTVDEAEATISRMFHICSKVVKTKEGNKLATADQVQTYFIQSVYTDVAHREGVRAHDKKPETG